MTQTRQFVVLWAAALVLCGAISGCSSVPRRPAVPFGRENLAAVPGFDGIRWWGDVADDPVFLEVAKQTIVRERAYRASRGEPGLAPSIAYLAVSGGGQDGAYGAGLLCGWTDAGTRPEFNVITGVSTGALIAPFVFAGPEYDRVLREVYTTIRTRDIMEERGLIHGFLSDAMADTKPLRKLLERYVDDEFVRKIAAEDAKGRLLLIGTTNLDAGRPVVWDLGAIAAAGKPESRKLIVNLMIASAAIPAFFPPVLIDIPIEGKSYQEMHVDGGAATQVFIFPPAFKLRTFVASLDAQRERKAFILRNGRLDPEWAETRPQTLTIAQRAISSLIQTQGLGDLYRIYLSCRRDGVAYKLAFIPATFKEPSKESFDPVYMKKLFQVGYEFGKSGAPWFEAPPAFADQDDWEKGLRKAN